MQNHVPIGKDRKTEITEGERKSLSDTLGFISPFLPWLHPSFFFERDALASMDLTSNPQWWEAGARKDVPHEIRGLIRLRGWDTLTVGERWDSPNRRHKVKEEATKLSKNPRTQTVQALTEVAGVIHGGFGPAKRGKSSRGLFFTGIFRYCFPLLSPLLAEAFFSVARSIHSNGHRRFENKGSQREREKLKIKGNFFLCFSPSSFALIFFPRSNRSTLSG